MYSPVARVVKDGAPAEGFGFYVFNLDFGSFVPGVYFAWVVEDDAPAAGFGLGFMFGVGMLSQEFICRLLGS